jgi:hypothetical protein
MKGYFLPVLGGLVVFMSLLSWPASSQPPMAPTTPPLTAAQLDQLVAPIALYPDSLVAQILMAATYPLEVVEAARWLQEPANSKATSLWRRCSNSHGTRASNRWFPFRRSCK